MTATISKSRNWVGPLIVTITALIMLFWSWGTWPDCVLDFGRELYVPWRLSAGDLLYRDIVSYFNGPLSPYTHALLFRIFGVSLRTLVVLNLFVIAALAIMLYRLIARAFGALAATSALVTFFILFAFAQLVFAGNYNFLCPYSYELPHGITLSVGAIYCLDNWRLSQRRPWIIASGALLGLVFLTKAEVFIAAAIALSVGAILTTGIRRLPKIHIAYFLIASVAPVALAVILLRAHGLSFVEALRGIAGAWRFMGNRELLKMPYFTNLAGTSDVGESVKIISIWLAGYVVFLGLPISLGFAMRNSRWAMTVAIALFVAITSTAIWRYHDVNWNNLIRPAPVVLGIVSAIALLGAIRRRRDDLILMMVMAIWSLALLAKMALNAHVNHYGFALAMPATIIILAIFVGAIPRAIERSGGNGNFMRGVALAAMIATFYPHLVRMQNFWSGKTVVIGTGGDAFRADTLRGPVISAAVDEINATVPADATLVVVPEGLLVNYLTRRVNPTGQLNFTPPAIVMYGEGELVEAFAAHPPDFILMAKIDAAEYGPRFFGIDYGKNLGGWMQQNYRRVRAIPPQNFKDAPFGVMLLRKWP